MKNTFYFRLWLSIRIWILAVVVNTLLGTFYLTEFTFRSSDAWEYVKLGLAWGSIFSFPVMLALLLTLKNCMEAGMTGSVIIRNIFLWGLICTVLVFIIFFFVISIGAPSVLVVLLGIALLSGIIGIASHYRSLLKCGSDYKTTQKYSHEN